MHIYSVTDPEFKPYGKVLDGYDTAELLAAMKEIDMPDEGTAYQVNIGTKDFILLLAKEDEIVDGVLDTSLVKAFRVPKGLPVEVYATTLHYAPCHTCPRCGFRVAVVLPKGTNTEKPDFEPKCEEDTWMTARNKWLLAHPDSKEAKRGAHIGLSGENLDISADNHNFQIWTVTTKATNSQWAYGTDYTAQDISLRTREGKIIPITLGENNQTTLALEGTSFNCSLTPSETRIAEGYLATYVSATLNANATCNAAIPMGGTFTVKFPSSANFALCRKMGGTSGSGSIHYVPFVSIEPTSESSDGATTTRTYRLGQGYTCNYRL